MAARFYFALGCLVMIVVYIIFLTNPMSINVNKQCQIIRILKDSKTRLAIPLQCLLGKSSMPTVLEVLRRSVFDLFQLQQHRKATLCVGTVDFGSQDRRQLLQSGLEWPRQLTPVVQQVTRAVEPLPSMAQYFKVPLLLGLVFATWSRRATSCKRLRQTAGSISSLKVRWWILDPIHCKFRLSNPTSFMDSALLPAL